MAAELVRHFGGHGAQGIEEIVLIPSGGGCYEISVDGRLVFSKRATGRHIDDRDAVALIEKNR